MTMERSCFLGLLSILSLALCQSDGDPSLIITPVVNGEFLKFDHRIRWPAGRSLNLSCQWKAHSLPKSQEEGFVFSWEPTVPKKQDNSGSSCQSCIEIINPKTSDSGTYKCTASDPNSASTSFHTEIDLDVWSLSDRRKCGPGFFQCPKTRHCIWQRFVCDGRPDCPGDGGDESEAQCGFGDPCAAKLPCRDGRCMDPTLCCDPIINPTNCTEIECCKPLIESNRHHFQLGIGSQHEIKVLHSTIYTIVGCILAFIVILIIVVLVICRYQMKRGWLGGSVAAGTRGGGARGQGWSIRFGRLGAGQAPVTRADLDLYFSYLHRLDSLGNGTGGRITYNVNNGVQVVAPPPPYSLGDGPPPYQPRDQAGAAAGAGAGAAEAVGGEQAQPLMEENNNEEGEGNNNGDINGNSDMVDHNEVRRREMAEAAAGGQQHQR